MTVHTRVSTAFTAAIAELDQRRATASAHLNQLDQTLALMRRLVSEAGAEPPAHGKREPSRRSPSRSPDRDTRDRERRAQILAVLDRGPATLRRIAQQIGTTVYLTTVALQQLAKERAVVRAGAGRATTWARRSETSRPAKPAKEEV